MYGTHLNLPVEESDITHNYTQNAWNWRHFTKVVGTTVGIILIASATQCGKESTAEKHPPTPSQPLLPNNHVQ